MPNRSTDALFQLVKSLEKSEKRNFKLYVKRNSSSEDLKIVKLFDALDKMEAYDEGQLLKKNKSIKKQQLSNMKAICTNKYFQAFGSLRMRTILISSYTSKWIMPGYCLIKAFTSKA